MSFKNGDQVSWKWGKGEGQGEIVEIFTEKVTKTIKGFSVTRDASKDEPAYLICQADKDKVLKSASELEHIKK